jgi:hypothetical protein
LIPQSLLIGALSVVVLAGVAVEYLTWKGILPRPSLSIGREPRASAPAMRAGATPAKVKVGAKIPVEITAVNEQGTAQVVVAKGKVPKAKKLLLVKYPDLPKVGLYFVNLKAMWSDGKMHYERSLCEPIDEHGKPVKCPELEMMLVDSGMVQITDAIAILGAPLHLNTFTIAMFVFTGVIFLMFGLSLNALLHIVPNVNVHWLPSVPGASG